MVRSRLLIIRERRVQTLGKASRAQMGIAQQHAHIAMAAEVLEVDQREAARRIAACLGDAGNRFMAQVVHAQFGGAG